MLTKLWSWHNNNENNYLAMLCNVNHMKWYAFFALDSSTLGKVHVEWN